MRLPHDKGIWRIREIRLQKSFPLVKFFIFWLKKGCIQFLLFLLVYQCRFHIWFFPDCGGWKRFEGNVMLNISFVALRLGASIVLTTQAWKWYIVISQSLVGTFFGKLKNEKYNISRLSFLVKVNLLLWLWSHYYIVNTYLFGSQKGLLLVF